MPGPMSVPNGSNEIVTIVEFNDDGKRFERKVSVQRLTGEQRVQLAHRGRLHTGKTATKRSK